MVDAPFAWLERLRVLAPEYAAFQADSTSFGVRFVQELRMAGIRPGVVLNPSQPLEVLDELLPLVDYVLLMGVEPGFSGQQFLPRTLERLRKLDALRKERGLKLSIMVDGGIAHENGPLCAQAGADILVGGAFVCCGQPDGVEAASRRFVEAVGR